MDIDGIGDSVVEKLTTPSLVGLLEEPRVLVKSFADLYRLKTEDLLNLEGFQKRSAEKLIKAIAASKTAGPARLLAALSIQGVGVQTAKAIVNKYRGFKGIENVERAEDFAVVDGIGKVLAENLFHFFHSPDGARIIAELRAEGLEMELPEDAATEDGAPRPLEGKTICVTGTLDGYDRVEIKETIERLGGKATSSVSKKTDFLLVGAKPGQNKIDKANELGVPQRTEEEFNAMILEKNE